MKETLRTYNSQFKFEPKIVNEHQIKKNYKQIVLCGMGGSHLPAGILKIIEPGIDIYVHRSYDLPPFSKSFLESSLLIASSFSGNTEEVISFYKKIKQLYELPVLCISMGGELLELAQKNNDPYILLPETEFVPRTAVGITTRALAYVLKDKHAFYNIGNIEVDINNIEIQAQEIAKSIGSRIPIFYSSNENLNLAYNWKIKINETAKQVAFYNSIPESNHNELESYGYLNNKEMFALIMLKDSNDHIRIQKRFEVFEEIINEKGIYNFSIDISNSDVYKKVFNSIVLGDFASTYMAESKNVPSKEVPLIESFKKRLI